MSRIKASVIKQEGDRPVPAGSAFILNSNNRPFPSAHGN